MLITFILRTSAGGVWVSVSDQLWPHILTACFFSQFIFAVSAGNMKSIACWAVEDFSRSRTFRTPAVENNKYKSFRDLATAWSTIFAAHSLIGSQICFFEQHHRVFLFNIITARINLSRTSLACAWDSLVMTVRGVIVLSWVWITRWCECVTPVPALTVNRSTRRSLPPLTQTLQHSWLLYVL